MAFRWCVNAAVKYENVRLGSVYSGNYEEIMHWIVIVAKTDSFKKSTRDYHHIALSLLNNDTFCVFSVKFIS